jgi:hypothetical protein
MPGKLPLLVLALVLATVGASAADINLGASLVTVVDFLAQRSPSRLGVVHGACLQKWGDRDAEIYLLLPRAEETGTIVMLEHEEALNTRIMTNMGFVTIRQGLAEISEHHGGMGTGQALRMAAERIISGQMSLDFSYWTIFTKLPGERCPPAP